MLGDTLVSETMSTRAVGAVSDDLSDDDPLPVRIDVQVDAVQRSVLSCPEMRTDVQRLAIVRDRVPRTMAVDGVFADTSDEVKARSVTEI